MKKFTTPQETYDYLNNCLENEIEDVFYLIWPESGILQGNHEKAIPYKNKKIYDMNRHGGVLVTNVGDISYVYLSKTPDKFNVLFCNFIIQKLREKGIYAYYSQNDLLIDSKFKFMGEMRIELKEDYYFFAGHISFSVLSDDIAQICTKKQEKIPRGLKEWGIYTEEVEQ